MIKEICYKLKEKRKQMGYTIEYVVSQTKIHPSVIKDIEAASLSGLGLTYLKGFIKIYANFLGVELGSALEEIDEVFSPFGRPKPQKIRRKAKKNQSIIKEPDQALKAKGPSIGKVIVGLLKKISSKLASKVVSIVIILLIIWGVFAGGRFIIRGIAGLFKREPKAKAVVQNLEDIKFTSTGELTVALTAKKKCYLRVMVDGKLFFEGILKKGSAERWSASKEMEFKISDGSAVSLEINGKSIPTLTSMPKQIKSLKITPSGITVDK